MVNEWLQDKWIITSYKNDHRYKKLIITTWCEQIIQTFLVLCIMEQVQYVQDQSYVNV